MEQRAPGRAGAGSGGVAGKDPLALSGSEKAAAVRRMFGAVAPRYDLLNHLLSLNIDRRWRRLAIDRMLAQLSPGGTVLDACAGTLDLSVELARRSAFRGRILACDFALPMLVHGAGKVGPLPIGRVCGDALSLPLADRSIDGAMVAFGVRNLASVEAGLTEFARVLKPGAPLLILEFTTPRWQPFRALYLFYFRHVLPRIGSAVSRHDSAYAYLPASVDRFPPPAELATLMERAGFGQVRWDSLTGGIAAMHIGKKQVTWPA